MVLPLVNGTIFIIIYINLQWNDGEMREILKCNRLYLDWGKHASLRYLDSFYAYPRLLSLQAVNDSYFALYNILPAANKMAGSAVIIIAISISRTLPNVFDYCVYHEYHRQFFRNIDHLLRYIRHYITLKA